MLHALNNLEDNVIHATDGEITRSKNFYFDDKQWVIRYLVVETGSWLFCQKVLLSPIPIKSLNLQDNTLTVSISREQVKTSPDIDTEKPVSRQYEIDYMKHDSYPYYWGNIGLWGNCPNPFMIVPHYPNLASQQDLFLIPALPLVKHLRKPSKIIMTA